MQNAQTGSATNNALADSFFEHGFVFPLEVFGAQQASSYRAELEGLERQLENQAVGNSDQLNYPHVIFRFANEIVRQPKILDVIESIIGPDIVVWGSTLQNEAIVDGTLAASPVAAGNEPDGTKAG